MPRVRTKICGITRGEDALKAAALGADAIGLIFYPYSRRYVDIDQARAIVDQLPPFVQSVGVFVDPNEKQVESTLKNIRIDLLQFHGHEHDDFCASFGINFMKAIRVGPGVDLVDAQNKYPSASALLLDTLVDNQAGGTGKTFDWQLIPRLDRPVILAGGLNPDNVRAAIEQVRPYGVDVSGGVESSDGVKDHGKMERFLSAVREVSLHDE